MNAFHVVGGLLALWAVVVAALGITRPGFPGRGGERAVAAISVLLVAATVGAAVITGSAESEEGGEQGEGEGASPTGALQVAADRAGQLRFDREGLEAPAGQVTITMDNPAGVRHNVAIDGNGLEEEGPVADPGETSTVSAQLPPGEYAFYCSVLGHREGGMTGTLTVR